MAFVYGISRNCVLRHLERDRRYVVYESDEGESADGNGNGLGGAYARSSDPLGDLTRAESVAQVRQAVLALPAKYREVVVLCDLEELSYEEASRALGCAVGSVRSRLHRARSLLLRKLKAGSAERNPGRIKAGAGGGTL